MPEEFDIMGLLSDPKKMNALLNLVALFQKAQSVRVDLTIWVNGIERAKVEDALKEVNLV